VFCSWSWFVLCIRSLFVNCLLTVLICEGLAHGPYLWDTIPNCIFCAWYQSKYERRYHYYMIKKKIWWDREACLAPLVYSPHVLLKATFLRKWVVLDHIITCMIYDCLFLVMWGNKEFLDGHARNKLLFKASHLSYVINISFVLIYRAFRHGFGSANLNPYNFKITILFQSSKLIGIQQKHLPLVIYKYIIMPKTIHVI
jgi:hypothetical protein